MNALSNEIGAGQAIDEQSGRLVMLGTHCTIKEAGALHQRLLKCLEQTTPVVLDAGDIDRVDAAGLQLLVGFTVDCMERGIVFSWSGRSKIFEQSVQRLGIGALLESPGAMVSYDAPGETGGKA